jgi:hypothetical protein
MGSVLFYLSLANLGEALIFELFNHAQIFIHLNLSTEMSLVVPVVNSLTFIFTHIVGMLLGEELSSTSKRDIQNVNRPTNTYNFVGTYLGIICIVTGVSICVLDPL